MFRVEKMQLLHGKTVNLHIPPGGILEIQGENGSGKSLLLKSLARLIPSNFLSLTLNQKECSEFSLELWRSQVMYMASDVFFQSDMTVQDYFYYPYQFALHKNLKPLFIPENYFSNLDQKMSSLSSGQKQFLSVLRTLSLNPEVILLDETFSHLDSHMRQKAISLILEWHAQDKMMCFVSHQELELTGDHQIYRMLSD